jgi:antitoxin HicB
MDIRYPATVEAQKDGTSLVQFVDMPDTFTEGLTKEEALFNAAEVLSAMLAWRLDQSKEVPAPSQKVRGAHYVAPDAKTQAAMLLRLARGERTLSELARALETS